MNPQEVWSAVEEINHLWTHGGGAGLEKWFHARMLAITPDRFEFTLGGDACVAGWKGFSAIARCIEWKTTGRQIELHGDTAVVAYHYELDCEIGARRTLLRGRDLLVLRRSETGWQVIADHFSPEPSQTAGA